MPNYKVNAVEGATGRIYKRRILVAGEVVTLAAEFAKDAVSKGYLEEVKEAPAAKEPVQKRKEKTVKEVE